MIVRGVTPTRSRALIVLAVCTSVACRAPAPHAGVGLAPPGSAAVSTVRDGAARQLPPSPVLAAPPPAEASPSTGRADDGPVRIAGEALAQVRCVPARVQRLSDALPVSCDVIADPGAEEAHRAPAAGVVARAARWPRAGERCGREGSTLLELLADAASPGALPAHWAVAAGDPSRRTLRWRCPEGWVIRVGVTPGTKVEAGTVVATTTPLGSLIARVRLPLQIATSLDPDSGTPRPVFLWLAGEAAHDPPVAPVQSRAALQRLGDSLRATVPLPAWPATVTKGAPGDRLDGFALWGPPQQLLAIPREAVQHRQQRLASVWVVGAGGAVTLRRVETGHDGGPLVGVVAGITAGDCVVVAGQGAVEAAVAAARSSRAGAPLLTPP